ncbi:MAG: 2OG-Fe(II) oxygenase, partial [Alphaproteobacteria bacterium]|nr:2OG-Fe(II) oxygenase [Alphaproteobacteria bacterium]
MAKLEPGDFVPDFTVAASTNAEFAFDSVGGWRVVLSFLGDLSLDNSIQVIDALGTQRRWLRERLARVIVVSGAQGNRAEALIKRFHAAGIVVFRDFDEAVGQRLGVESWHGSLVINENLRLVEAIPLSDAASHVAAVLSAVDRLPRLPARTGVGHQAPALVVPEVFDADLCRRLIQAFETKGGRDSGYMNARGGQTIGVVNHRFKRRSDVYVTDHALRRLLLERIVRRVVPEIKKAFATVVTNIERFLIARYDAETGGHFSPHRDNTTPGTAHRKFAITINLNAEEFEGGELRFPEYSRDTYRAPTGGAVVFSCSLMHEAL